MIFATQVIVFTMAVGLAQVTPVAAQISSTNNTALLSEGEDLAVQSANPGPWGKVTYYPIFLEAPNSLVESFPLPNPMPRWSFPEEDVTRLPLILGEAGLSAELISQLVVPRLQVREGGWVHLFPPLQEVDKLSATVRGNLYRELGKHEVNEFQHDPVLILTDTVEEWYRSSRLRPELVKKIEQLAYRRGDAWAFSDLPLLLNFAQNESEARIIFKSFTRTRTYLVRLGISPETNLSELLDYWTIGGRSFRLKDIEPLLSSLQETKQDINLDVAHMMPALPRKLLYTYPGIEFVAKGALPDCHWTSLNFFKFDPHEYFLDPRLATNRVLEDYKPVSPPFAYGDILFFLDSKDGNAFHSCTYIADNLVFTKNGRNQLSPWIISTIEDVTRVYLSMTPGRIQAYRQLPDDMP